MDSPSDTHTLPEVIAAVASYACQHNLADVVTELLAVADIQKVDPVALHLFHLRQLYSDLDATLKDVITDVMASLKELEKHVQRHLIHGQIKTTLFYFQCCYVNIIALESETPNKLIAFYNAVNECFPANYTSARADNVSLYKQTRELYFKLVPNLADFQFYSKNEAPKRLQSHKLRALSELHELLPMLDEYLKSEHSDDTFFGVNLAENAVWKQYKMYYGEAAPITDLEFASFLRSMHLRANLENLEIAGTQSMAVE
uniref:PCI domain-containing protein n=1 Tax=Panagrellus redivivus TaxID=6233 RepID=A0A7E4UR80_PANRE